MKRYILYAGQGWRKNIFIKEDDSMSMNMDSSYLFEQMFGVANVAKNVANSKQYQTVVKSMMTAGRFRKFVGYTGVKFAPYSAEAHKPLPLRAYCDSYYKIFRRIMKCL